MRGKIGSSHFEIIISFLFFMGFVFFLFSTLSPEDNTVLSDSTVSQLFFSFNDLAVIDLSTVFLKADYVGTNTCFNVDFGDGFFNSAVSTYGSHVVDLDGNEIDSEFSGTALDVDSGYGEFFRVSISSEFEDEIMSSCEDFTSYKVGAIIERSVVSWSVFSDMADKYVSDYDGLKADLKVPEVFDFAIIPENLPFSMEPTIGIPDSVEISAYNHVFEILREDGTLRKEEVSFQVWR
jgi:hypothetical protein